MSKKQALFFLILILLLTASLAGLTYFLAKKRVQPQPEKISPANTNATNTAVASPEPVELDTSDLSAEALAQEDWLTYRNEEYGFELKYPEGWGPIIEEKDNLGILRQIVINSKPDDSYYAPLAILMRKNLEKLSFYDWYTKSYPKNLDDLSEFQEIEINGVSFFRLHKKNLTDRYYVVSDDKIFSFGVVDIQKNINRQNQIERTILSTFKFTK